MGPPTPAPLTRMLAPPADMTASTRTTQARWAVNAEASPLSTKAAPKALPTVQKVVLTYPEAYEADRM